MKKFNYILLFLGYFLIACSTTKTTKVYIEVGVNDYTKRNSAQNGNYDTKSKKLNSGYYGPINQPTKNTVTKKAD